MSSHGIVFVFIAATPDCTIQESSTALFISRKTVWSLVGDLNSARMIQIRRDGRTHHYAVNVDLQLRHATLGGRSMLDMVKSLMEPLPGSPKQ